uniref:L-seryl-tRNA(Sec) kinase n=1 Tax=Clastoptera arizonana TaxID=38151 RepID=A0A1B6CBV1_9HEMI
MCDDGPSICIVMLMGIPASGKSYFRQRLEVLLKNGSLELNNVYPVSISFDDYIDSEIDFHKDPSIWKEKRLDIYSKLENMIDKLINKNSLDTNLCAEFDLNVANQSQLVVFIIDDNMYYKSMRYKYYNLAKKYNTSYCQFYLKANLKDALIFNQKRKNVVSDSTIIKMYNNIEPPNINNKWEENSLEIESFIDFNNKQFLDSITSIVQLSVKFPIKSTKQENNKEEAQKVTNTNVIHQIDLILRSIVGERMNKAKESITDVKVLKDVGKVYCSRRIQILQNIKVGEIMLPFPALTFDNLQDVELLKRFLFQYI